MTGLTKRARSALDFLPRCLALAAVLGTALQANAFEFLDGRLEVHGFFEEQIRVLGRDLEPADDLDLAQAYSVLNVEIEWDLVDEGWGPFDLVSMFARLEGRYDCVWVRCGIFRAVDSFGDRAGHLPKRLADARGAGLIQTVDGGDRRPVLGKPIEQLELAFRDFPAGHRRRPSPLFVIDGFDTLFSVEGPDGTLGTDDDPALYVFERYFQPGHPYLFAAREIKGPEDGIDTQVLGPWLPENQIVPIGALSDRANPFRVGDIHPIYGLPGSTERPYRPAPALGFDDPPATAEAQGIYYPNAEFAELLRSGEFDAFDQNFRQAELAWNRGASQQDEKELKEFYFDLEFFESRLWLRVGRQNIVWGKTEIFRTTDQFNPQDLALASLPSLEESRIALWAIRGVWSFWEVGPLQDVRLEVALNYDQFEPTDLGRCGEAFTPNPVCQKTFALFAHGATGIGIAGEIRPPDPWNSFKGIEAGARLEFRWDRFSFQISDFYGYRDLFFVDRIFTYERNVDPVTGLPRETNARGSCANLGTVTETPPGSGRFLTDRTGDDCLLPEAALTRHHANQQLFAMICASSFGFSDLDPSVCAQSVLNSPVFPVGLPFTVSQLLSFSIAGNQSVGTLLEAGGFAPPGTLSVLLVPTNEDPGDRTLGSGLGDPISPALATALTPEQQALLGCGPFWGAHCDDEGIDLLNAEASVLTQSFLGFEGTSGSPSAMDASLVQPGTVGFEGGPVGTRFVPGVGTVVLPGARSQFFGEADLDPALWNVLQDGCAAPGRFGCNAGDLGRATPAAALLHPLTGQQFRSEMAAVSWNLLLAFVTLSGLGEDPAVRAARLDFFDPSNPFAPDKCSFQKPYFCDNVLALYSVIGNRRATVRAGGRNRFGRRDFIWHEGGDAVLRYEKRNVLGFALDWAEDVTKSNWSVETTWIEDVPFADNDEFDGIRRVDTYNLTVSVDRPTFVNFLNPNRTFFINTQWFFQYVNGYRKGFTTGGPFNVLMTFTVNTGYFRDRLLPGVTFVYDRRSNSGAALPSIGYRLTENFSVIVGMNFFWGRFEAKRAPINPLGVGENRVGREANEVFVENLVSAIRDRDELFLRIRYTF